MPKKVRIQHCQSRNNIPIERFPILKVQGFKYFILLLLLNREMVSLGGYYDAAKKSVHTLEFAHTAEVLLLGHKGFRW